MGDEEKKIEIKILLQTCRGLRVVILNSVTMKKDRLILKKVLIKFFIDIQTNIHPIDHIEFNLQSILSFQPWKCN